MRALHHWLLMPNRRHHRRDAQHQSWLVPQLRVKRRPPTLPRWLKGQLWLHRGHWRRGAVQAVRRFLIPAQPFHPLTASLRPLSVILLAVCGTQVAPGSVLSDLQRHRWVALLRLERLRVPAVHRQQYCNAAVNSRSRHCDCVALARLVWLEEALQSHTPWSSHPLAQDGSQFALGDACTPEAIAGVLPGKLIP